jgi:hypothetical protein
MGQALASKRIRQFEEGSLKVPLNLTLLFISGGCMELSRSVRKARFRINASIKWEEPLIISITTAPADLNTK